MRKLALALILTSVAWLATASLAEDPAPAAKPGAAGALGVEKLPDTVKLTEKDVTGFITASQKLRKLDIDEKVQKEADSVTEAFELNKDAMAIIDAQGFTPDRFQTVAYNIGMALAANEMKKSPEELAAARAQQEQALAEMKDKLTPEQYDQMQKRLEMASGMVEQLSKLPPENRVLVAKYETQIRAAVGQAEGE